MFDKSYIYREKNNGRRQSLTREPGDYISLSPNAAAHVDTYFEYRAIVGDDDGGNLFSPEEYDAYTRRVLPILLHSRLYVSWVNPLGMDCILIGSQHKCLCRHNGFRAPFKYACGESAYKHITLVETKQERE
ncbi:unnamed protein product [Adineta steineri]|uniref:Protein FAM221A n=1 Tax=Adineta steineri TaxID=433720 RepID=A0A814L9S1_9BILA|nr:unnamed protein product [Adineta steineri]CAF3792391.1 unnamed protein product [Adineta steineri]CAF3815525.1 unnamed protein product [Adineta steineri]